MKQIFLPSDQAGKLAGIQKEKEDARYRFSKHCLAVCCEDGKLYYHSLTGAMYLAGNGEDVRKELIRNWFLVPEDFDENKHAREIHNVLALLRRPEKNTTKFTILTTTDCNARCSYCYQIGKRRFGMDLNTANDVSDYIARKCGGEKVRLNWFGGEPLYNWEVIDSIINKLRIRGIPFISTMTSNAYFLDRETATKAANDWKLERIQITLDGTKETYNRIKAFISRDEDAFSRVLDNIGYALDAGIKVTVRLNMDSENAEDLSELCGILSERFGERKGLAVYADLLIDYSGKVHTFRSHKESADKCIALREKIWDLGLGSPGKLKRELKVNRCMADGPGSEVILPDGSINRCEHFDENETLGTIYDDKKNSALLNSWKERVYFPECGDCVLYPRCFNLKKCEELLNGCIPSRRMVKTHLLQEQLLYAYREWKQAVDEGKQNRSISNEDQ